MTVESLMKLLGAVTGWDQSLRVEMGYKEAREWVTHDETRVIKGDWGWVVGTTVCGGGDTVVCAQAKELPMALYNLAVAVYKRQVRLGDAHQGKAQRMQQHLNTWDDEIRKGGGLMGSEA